MIISTNNDSSPPGSFRWQLSPLGPWTQLVPLHRRRHRVICLLVLPNTLCKWIGSRDKFNYWKPLYWLVVWNIFCVLHILRMSSSQLTKSYFSEGWVYHQPAIFTVNIEWVSWFDFPYQSSDLNGKHGNGSRKRFIDRGFPRHVWFPWEGMFFFSSRNDVSNDT